MQISTQFGLTKSPRLTVKDLQIGDVAMLRDGQLVMRVTVLPRLVDFPVHMSPLLYLRAGAVRLVLDEQLVDRVFSEATLEVIGDDLPF